MRSAAGRGRSGSIPPRRAGYDDVMNVADPTPLSPAVQDYLKAVFLLSEDRGGDEGVTGGRIAEELGVTPPSVSNMLDRLEDLDYLETASDAPDRRAGVLLTEAGRRAALAVVRRHRLLETYLVLRLGMTWDEVHREAEVLEHHISETLAERMADALGHPERDPHGHPIPAADGTLPPPAGVPLVDLQTGARGRIERVSDRDSDLLRYLADRGLVPQAEVEVLEVAPFGGPITVRVGGSDTVDVPPGAAQALEITL